MADLTRDPTDPTSNGTADNAEDAAADDRLRDQRDLRGPVPPDVVDPQAAAVFRAFFVDGRLTTMPARRSKRLIVLDHIARIFEPGVDYPETEVNVYLRAFHPDFAMLRRYLVDEGFLSRDHGRYWRTGGGVVL